MKCFSPDAKKNYENCLKQESPPAWTQEAYRPPCSEYSFCCPTWVSPPILTWRGGTRSVPPRGGTWSGTPPARVPPRGGTRSGTPPARVPPLLPHGILGNVAKHYGIWVPPPGVDRQTKWNYYLPVVLRTRAVITFFRRNIFTDNISTVTLHRHLSPGIRQLSYT